MKIPDLKKAIEGIGFKDEQSKTLKDRLGEIKDNNSLNKFYEEWKEFLKTTYLSLHPDKNREKKGDFIDFREKAVLVNEYIDLFTKNDDGTRKFKDSDNQEAFLKSTNAIKVSNFSNLNSGLNADFSSSAKSPNRGTSSPEEKFKSFEDLYKDVNWNKVFKPEPPIKPSWLASVDDSGNLVVINSDGKKDENSKILEKAMWHISEQNASVKDRFEISSETISGVIVIISKEEMNNKIAQNRDAIEGDKKDQESIRVPIDLDITSSRKMIGKHEENSLEVAVVKNSKSVGSFASKHPSNKVPSPTASKPKQGPTR